MKKWHCKRFMKWGNTPDCNRWEGGCTPECELIRQPEEGV